MSAQQYLDISSVLAGGYHHPLLRNYQARGRTLNKDMLMYPIFITDDPEAEVEIPTLPGQKRWGINRLEGFLRPLVDKGLKSVILFGVPLELEKDEVGTHADSDVTPVVQALKLLSKLFPRLLLAADVCLCEYTNHGHCGVPSSYIQNGKRVTKTHGDGVYSDANPLVDSTTLPQQNSASTAKSAHMTASSHSKHTPVPNFLNGAPHLDMSASANRVADVALSYAKAGAHIVAPSDMMDGRIKAIKLRLIEEGYANRCGLMSYSAKFASGLYGPFRDAAGSAPMAGDRKCYQLPPFAKGLARRAINRDALEGADILMVKPSLPYLDIIQDCATLQPDLPTACYQVSGEYAMIYAGAKAGVYDLRQMAEETVGSMIRAGASIILTYFTPEFLEWLDAEPLPH
ncbi:hypothetical protein NliqN6_4189 [Naganishia liquefaciens]|uniref:Delta-aminolevulinic acid dehydratase n=1 Tax=Naganishia liquefaciens TaxID=104408 RepID=A0A8H3TV93_9TREE|nr:hypothetical protein NliqN6_4189 [Naganishia liquefaciens]